MKQKKNLLKSKKGITLIALVVTVVVLIILAMVTMAMVTGPNGIINRARESQIENDKGAIKDLVQTEVLGSVDENERIEWDSLVENLENNVGAKDVRPTDGEDIENGVTFEVEKNGRVYTVEVTEDEDGKKEVTVEYDKIPPAQITFKYYDGEPKEKTIISTKGKVKPPAVTTQNEFTPRGWSTSENANAVVEASTTEEIKVTEAKTYFMSYERGVTVIHNSQGGSSIGNSTGIAYLNYKGEPTPANVKLGSAPSRSNYNFQGWTDTAGSQSGKWSAGSTISVTDKTKTVYAAWKLAYKYHCNWCNQDTNDIHYRCPTHYSSMSCSTSRNTCNKSAGTCGARMATSGTTMPSRSKIQP